ncbi:MAG: response regulator [Pseudomonadota bacterium]
MLRIPIKVLLVDDEKDFVEIFSLRPEEIGENVRAAFSGKECLETLDKAEIDVVILDIKMPGMDGIEALREIKKRHPLVEVILLTGHGAVDTAVEGMKLGAYDYLLKPTNFRNLMVKLEGARKRKSEQEDRIRKAKADVLVRRSGDI